jgi:P-type Mg2+ transporter
LIWRKLQKAAFDDGEVACQNPAQLHMNFLSKPPKETGRLRPEVAVHDGLLVAISQLQPDEACAKLGSAPDGLSEAEATVRARSFGPNLVARERKATIPEELWSRARNPLNALLLTLATVSYFLGDVRAAVVIATMVVLAITTAFIQEHRSNDRNRPARPEPFG